MAERPATEHERRLIGATVARLRASILAVVFGVFAGTALAVATLWLVVRGGPDVGRHLGLLRHYFPGYSVTGPGAAVGFVYGVLVGAVIGWTTAWIYNWVANLRARTR